MNCTTGPTSRSTTGRFLIAASITALGFGVPATTDAQSSVQSISQSDRQEGAQANPALIAQFGGAIAGPQADYVAGIGRNIAVQSGLGNARSDFTVNLLNSSVNNAFAIPGGYVYVTRQLVSLMNNEAELAGVLGHEVGHVAARHSAKRQSAATRNSILGALGSVLGGAILGNGQIGQYVQQGLQQGSQLLTLKYSRSQETEADALGVLYLGRAGYDPRGMAMVLQSLANQEALDSRLAGSNKTTPAWASTHPDPASRVRAAQIAAGPNPNGITNRDTFLSRIDGLMYGDDPRQGIVNGRSFIHPEFGLAFDAPAGFALTNGTRAVSITGQSGKGEFTSAAYNGNLDDYIARVFAGLTEQGSAQVSPQNIEHINRNGVPAAIGSARVNTGNGEVDVVVFAYEFARDKAYHFLTISQAGSSGQFNPMFDSLRRISASQAASVRPRRVRVVTARPGDTVQSLSRQMAYSDAPMERFMVLNALSSGSRIAAGQRVKIVTY